MTARLPGIVRVLLRVVPLGDHRDEVSSDLAELFEQRQRERGFAFAYGRLFLDLASLLKPRPTRVSADIRHGLRLFRKHPFVIGAAIGGLSLAMAVGTSVFAMLNASTIRPYGMDDPKSVVRVQMLLKGGLANDWPYHAFAGLRAGATQAHVIASMPEQVHVATSAGETPARADAIFFVSGEYLPVLGGRAIEGRSLLPSDDDPGATPVVVVSHRFWTQRLNGDHSIVGRTIWLQGSAVTVVGVLGASFTGPEDKAPALWAPFASYGPVFHERSFDRSSTARVSVIGRVTSVATRSSAEQELSGLAAALPDTSIRTEAGGAIPVTGVRLDGASSPMDGADSADMWAVVGAVSLAVLLVLALACANVANLLLAGASARAREIALRLALGASRGDVLRQLLTESVLIGAVAGLAGLLLSAWLLPVVARAVGLADVDVEPDWPVIWFTAVAAIVCGFAAGLAPARHGSRTDLLGVLKSQGAQSSSPLKAARTRRVFIGVQAAASILLLVTAALFLHAAVRAVNVTIGFDADRLVAVTPAFPRSGFDGPAVDAYWRATLDRIRALPSVERAALASFQPFGGEVAIREVARLNQGGVTYQIYENQTDADYFAAAGFRLVRGRAFTADEVRANAPVAVVSADVARDFFGDADPIGASLAAVSDDLRRFTVIGVVGESLTGRMRGRGNGAIYRPLPASDVASARVIVRTAHPAAVARDLENVLMSVDSRVRVTTTLIGDDVDRAMNEPRVLAAMSGAVAALALLLAVLGVYGVTTLVVDQRMWEMHVRRAIGAPVASIVRLLVWQNLTPVAIGLAVGLAIALEGIRVLAPALSGLSPYDPPAIVGAVVLLVVTALAAVMLPARKAAHADPAAVLRQ